MSKRSNYYRIDNSRPAWFAEAVDNLLTDFGKAFGLLFRAICRLLPGGKG